MEDRFNVSGSLVGVYNAERARLEHKVGAGISLIFNGLNALANGRTADEINKAIALARVEVIEEKYKLRGMSN